MAIAPRIVARPVSVMPNWTRTDSASSGASTSFAAYREPGQLEEVEKGGQRGAFLQSLPADADTDPAGGPEHRLDQGRVGVEVGREDQHVGRLDVGVRVEEAQQAVVQDLDLAGRRVADVDLDRVVRFRSSRSAAGGASGSSSRMCRWTEARQVGRASTSPWSFRGAARTPGPGADQSAQVPCRLAPGVEQFVGLDVPGVGGLLQKSRLGLSR